MISASLSIEANPVKTKKKICVIGTGVSGLGAAKHVADFKNEFDLVVFEKNNDVGGQWSYTDKTGVDNHGLPMHSSVYKYLRYSNSNFFNKVFLVRCLYIYIFFSGQIFQEC